MVGYGKFAVGAVFAHQVCAQRSSRRLDKRKGWTDSAAIRGNAVDKVDIKAKRQEKGSENQVIGDTASSGGPGVPPLFVQLILKWFSALGLAAVLHAGIPSPSFGFDGSYIGSAGEDRLLEVIRAVEAQANMFWTKAGNVSPWQKEAKKEDVEAQKTLIEEVYDVVVRNFDDSRKRGFDVEEWTQLKDQILARKLTDAASGRNAVREMLLRLRDPYSRFLSPEEFSAMSKYDISGVGLNLGTLQELQEKTGLSPSVASSGSSGAWVVGLIRSSPADAAGLKQGDQILSIEGVDLTNKSPFEVASLLQAPAGNETNENDWFGISKVSPESDTLTVKVRDVGGKMNTTKLTRPQMIPTPSPVMSKFDSNSKTGYIKLVSFNARAQRDVSGAVQSLAEYGATNLVLDLRGNRGGLVSEGIEVANLFLPGDDVIVRSQIKSRTSEKVIRASGKPLTNLPLTVLVDGGTASASEIFAGALQDNCRAPLVGQKTYGKGLIQSVYELSDGSGLVLTVGSYLTPSGINIDWEGLTPDFRFSPSQQEVHKALKACKIRHQK